MNTPLELLQGLATALVIVYTGIKEWKERRAIKTGLRANPTRCKDHENRLRDVELSLARLEIKVQDSCQHILTLHNKLMEK